MVMQTLLYDLAPEAFVESDVVYMRHTWKFDDACMGAINPAGTENELSLWMVQRSVFDNVLAQDAVQSGQSCLTV